MMEHINISEFKYEPSPRGVGEEFLLREGNLRTKLLKFKSGDSVPFHTHTDEKHEKLIVSGKGEFTDDTGEKVTLGSGFMYMCGSGKTYYSGTFIEDTIILVIESSDSVILDRP